MKKVSKRESYIVTLVRPPGVTRQEMAAYIESAVAIWHKGGDPDEPIFDLDGATVRAKPAPKEVAS